MISLYNCGYFQMIWASLAYICSSECVKILSRSSLLIRESKSFKNFLHTGYSDGSAIVGTTAPQILLNFCSFRCGAFFGLIRGGAYSKP